MQRAGQTTHGARPNREEVRSFGLEHVPARCVKPSGRSLEPRSNARPRGMAVPPEQSGGQNSAYRSGCHRFSKFILREHSMSAPSRRPEIRRRRTRKEKIVQLRKRLAAAKTDADRT